MANPKSKEIVINMPQEGPLPKFSNLVAASSSKERGEVILDFLFVDERMKNKEGKIIGNPVSRIVISMNSAKQLIKLLSKMTGVK